MRIAYDDIRFVTFDHTFVMYYDVKYMMNRSMLVEQFTCRRVSR